MAIGDQTWADNALQISAAQQEAQLQMLQQEYQIKQMIVH